jgi:hypothetical protein
MKRPRGKPTSSDPHRELATVLGDLRQRRLFSILLVRSRPISCRELATRLVAYDDSVQRSELSEAEIRRTMTDLEHRCLAELDTLGLIERTGTGIVAADPLSIETTLSLPSLRDPENSAWEPISVLLGSPVRQAVVSVFAGHEESLTVRDLTTELCTQPQFDQGTASVDAQQLQLRLHHLSLPKLATVDLVTYDPSAQTVARTKRTVDIARQTGLDTLPTV